MRRAAEPYHLKTRVGVGGDRIETRRTVVRAQTYHEFVFEVVAYHLRELETPASAIERITGGSPQQNYYARPSEPDDLKIDFHDDFEIWVEGKRRIPHSPRYFSYHDEVEEPDSFFEGFEQDLMRCLKCVRVSTKQMRDELIERMRTTYYSALPADLRSNPIRDCR